MNSITPDKVYPSNSEAEVATTECEVSWLEGDGISGVGEPSSGVGAISGRLAIAHAVAVAMMR